MDMQLKRKLLEELLCELDEKESMKLKPKEEAPVEIEIEASKSPKDETMEMVENGDDEEMDDEDLKKLLKEYSMGA